jgi:hypothetical protein
MKRTLALAGAATLVVVFAVPSGAGGYSRPGTYIQVDLTNAGQAPDGSVHHTSISGTGRYVAFDSDAPLTPGTGGFVPGGITSPPSNVFVRDLATRRIELVSQRIGPPTPHPTACPLFAVPGARFDASESFDPSISADGRFIAFTSFARLVSSQAAGGTVANVFVFDRRTQRTTLVSVDSSGRQVNGCSYTPSISANGRYVSFTSVASNLVSGDTNNAPDVFVHDLRTGKTTRVSVSSADAQASWPCPLGLPPVPSAVPVVGGCYAYDQLLGSYQYDPSSSISATGQYVAFDYPPSNLVSGDTDGMYDVYVHDVKTGKTTRVSVATGGAQAQYMPWQNSTTNDSGSSLMGYTQGTYESPEHAISANGRYVVFESTARNLVPNINDPAFDFATYVHDLWTDRTYQVSVRPDGSSCTASLDGVVLAGPAAFYPSMSADGRYVAYESHCDEAATSSCGIRNGSNGCTEYVYDTVSGQVDGLPSLLPSGQHYTGQNGRTYTGFSHAVDISSDGHYVSLPWDYDYPSKGLAGLTDAFMWDRGPTVGVGGLAAAGKLSVAGAPSFPSTGVIAATSTANLNQALTADGANLFAASLAYRPAHGDLFAKLELAQMPMFAAANPALVYGLRLTVNGTRYEVRAAKGGSDALTSGGGASFGLFRLAQGAWTKVATLHGGYGTAGADVTVALPLSMFGVQSGGRLSDVSAFTAVGSYDTGAAQVLDQVVLAGSSR